ncbi:MAG: hypothetical protein JWM32_404 [Verrucomicrobia bacterium]|nr:hypothetical protein [Verrucomicrobiota bacterium]
MFLWVATAAFWSGAVHGAEAAVDVDARHWQFFIDDYVIARGTGLDRVVHQPRARGVVVANDRPWESNGVAPGYFARKADGSFVGYYSAITWVPDPEGKISRNGKIQKDRAQQYVVADAYATSADGIHWDKPALGLVEAPTGIDWKAFPPFPSPVGSSRENNLGVPFGVTDLGSYGNVTDPSRRFALSVEGRAYFAAEIPDFIHDRAWKAKLVDAGGAFSPRGGALHFWDAANAEWVALVQNAIPHWLPSREIARFASKDLKTWTSEIVLAPDSADPHRPDYYDEPMGIIPFHADGVVLGILSWIHTDRTTPDGGPVMERTPGSPVQGWPWPKTEAHPNNWPWARKGANELRITISRDGGKTWDRKASREPWIPHGTEEDSYNRLVIGSAPPVRVGDEDWFYTAVCDGDHLSTRANATQRNYYSDRVRRGQIALFTQKHNRYVSLRANTQLETLITKPFVVSGENLQLNVDASRGRVRVAIAEYKPVLTLKNTTDSVDPHLMEQNVLAGFTRDDCVPIEANNIEQVVQFKQGASLRALQGRRVVLFVEMVDADLYSFRIQ